MPQFQDPLLRSPEDKKDVLQSDLTPLLIREEDLKRKGEEAAPGQEREKTREADDGRKPRH